MLRAIYGLPLNRKQQELWEECTGRGEYHAKGFQEVTVLAGARAGKDSRIAVPILLYEALFRQHRFHKGERPVYPLVAQDTRATKIAFDYAKSYLSESPILRSEIADLRHNEIEFQGGARVFCFPSTAASLRGWSVPCGVMDELGFWRIEGQVDSDVEIQTSIRRGMIGIDKTKLIKISTPYMRSGVLYNDFERHYGRDSADLLVWRAPTALMNPSIRKERLEREKRLDPERYRREYEAEFGHDLLSLFDDAALQAVTVPGRNELAPVTGVAYTAFCDPSAGKNDSFGLCIAHSVDQLGGVIQEPEPSADWEIRTFGPQIAWEFDQEARNPTRRVESRRAVIDLAREWRAPFSPSVIIAEISTILRAYGLSSVVGDRYASAYPGEVFKSHGIEYRISERDRSQLFLELLGIVNSGRIELPDDSTLLRQLRALERRTSPSGKDRVDHPQRVGAHDDLANSVAGASAELLSVERHSWSVTRF